MARVLVLDAELKTMLAVIRSLGKRGIQVVAVSQGKMGGYFSKYCWKRIDLSDFPENVKSEAIKRIIEIDKINSIFAHLETTILSAAKLAEETKAKIIAPPIDTLKFLTDKYKVIKLAENLGIKVPKTRVVCKDEDISTVTEDFDFPFIAKTATEINLPPGPGSRYILVKDKKDLEIFKKFIDKNNKVLVQEYVTGHGCGIGGLFYNGKPVAVGGHKRLREAFKTGGPSTLAVSYIDKKALKFSLDLMKELKYSGFGMVEFKISEDGEPYLMEINPRIWGTFPLYIKSGLDLPYLAYKLFVEEDFGVLDENYLNGFREGVKILYLLEDLKAIASQHSSKLEIFSNVIKDILYLIFDPYTKEGIFEWDDPKPFVFSLIHAIGKRFLK